VVTKEEALKLALEALENKHYQEAHYLIVQALAQPAQEPVGYAHWEARIRELMKQVGMPNSISLAQAMPQFVNELRQPAQPAQEPVACIHKGYLYMAHEFMSGIPDGATLLYTTPPAAQPAQEPEPDELTIAYMSGLLDGKKQRPWVRLTLDERNKLYEKYHDQHGLPKQGYLDGFDYERAIEAKLKAVNGFLKEKNNG